MMPVLSIYRQDCAQVEAAVASGSVVSLSLSSFDMGESHWPHLAQDKGPQESHLQCLRTSPECPQILNWSCTRK